MMGAPASRIGVIGAGWSGLCAAVAAVQAGHQVCVFEASAHLGGRARRLEHVLPNGQPVTLDNGQHILIGAYRRTLALMALVGLDQHAAFLQSPLRLRYHDGGGLALPDWPSPLDAIAGVLSARGWSAFDRWSLVRHMWHWRRAGFRCEAQLSVQALCQNLSPRVFHELIEPLCVSALNTPSETASAQVFLRVLQDSLLGPRGSSHVLLPRCDLGALLPYPASSWLTARGARILTRRRVRSVQRDGVGWQVEGEAFDQVILATSATHAQYLLEASASQMTPPDQAAIDAWLNKACALRFEAITTVYAWAENAQLVQPMLALRSDGPQAPAQFVFDRGRLEGPSGLLAFVVSASQGEREDLQNRVLGQAFTQLGLRLAPVLTVVEKQATFACTPGLVRPSTQVLSGLLVCGDYIEGPYPATLEGAVQSAEHAVSLLGNKGR